MPRRPDLPCADCGRMLWRGSGSLPEGRARCQPCRHMGRVASPVCEFCGVVFTPTSNLTRLRRFCSRLCANRAHAPAFTRSPTDHRSTRAIREAAAPGLNRVQRNRLLRKWKRQGRSCAYCSGPPASIDHVVPLILGGTNF